MKLDLIIRADEILTMDPARPRAAAVGVIGDGAFGLSAMEVESAVRAGANPVLVVSNNASWGDVRYEETEWFGATRGTDLTPARYDLLAEALGGHGERVERTADFAAALDRALAAEGPALIHIVIDSEVMPPASAEIAPAAEEENA